MKRKMKNEKVLSPIRGMSLLEILISLGILVSSIVIVFSVMAQGLMVIKKGENYSVALNIAMAQFEAYRGNFHMIPFFPGKADPTNINKLRKTILTSGRTRCSPLITATGKILPIKNFCLAGSGEEKWRCNID